MSSEKITDDDGNIIGMEVTFTIRMDENGFLFVDPYSYMGERVTTISKHTVKVDIPLMTPQDVLLKRVEILEGQKATKKQVVSDEIAKIDDKIQKLLAIEAPVTVAVDLPQDHLLGDEDDDIPF